MLNKSVWDEWLLCTRMARALMSIERHREVENRMKKKSFHIRHSWCNTPNEYEPLASHQPLFLNMTKALLKRLSIPTTRNTHKDTHIHIYTRFLERLHQILTITRNFGASFYFYCFIIAKPHKSDLLPAYCWLGC